MGETRDVERFVVRYVDDVPELRDRLGIREGEFCWLLIDTETGEAVGCDGGEPEDQLLVRDWSWVPKVLNHLAAELTEARTEVERLRRELLSIRAMGRGLPGMSGHLSEIAGRALREYDNK